MSTHEKETFLQTYDWAKDWSQLPWAHDEPTLFLAELCQQRPAGKALDIGCGAGTDSVYLAKRGWEVTSLDFVPKALEFTQHRAEQAGVSVTPVEADITRWTVPGRYDLVLDHGLLHNMDPVRHADYRQRIVDAVADNGDLVLLHWHPRFPGQVNGKVGPRRVSREDIKAFFAPEFQERFFAMEEFEDLPDIVGGGMVQAYYWFRRNHAQLQPAELLKQLRATLERHKVDYQSILESAGPDVLAPVLPASLMARVIGPGRLGIVHRVPEPGEVDGLLADWAATTGEPVHRVVNLLRLFASAEHGKICTANPQCNTCEVHFCKRLRYR